MGVERSAAKPCPRFAGCRGGVTFGSTTRVRANSVLLHPDTGGLTMATFRQTTSRAE